MGGGLMQLVAYGAQDVYLTGNPQITFFKVVYRRHTNFSMESIQQTFDGTSDFGKRVSCTISRNGDLISNMYIRCGVTGTTGNITATGATAAGDKVTMQTGTTLTGYRMIKSATLEIGGQQIDKHYGHWMNVWSQLSTTAAQKPNLQSMVHSDGVLEVKTMVAGQLDNADNFGNNQTYTTSEKEMYIPMQFWFCRNPGLALPLIALQYHEVKLVVEFENAGNIGKTTPDVLAETNGANKTLDCSVAFSTSPELYVDYIYLDTDERRRFAQVSHEYLIEQLQFTGDETVAAGTAKKHQLNFNHPVKELVWAQFTAEADVNPKVGTQAKTVRLQLNGHDRFSEREGMYFTNVQPYQHHTASPDADGNGSVHVYSFALKPEEHQPSGTCNMSRIDTAVLNLKPSDMAATKLRIYAVNYNVLRIMSGMGGLAYSN